MYNCLNHQAKRFDPYVNSSGAMDWSTGYENVLFKLKVDTETSQATKSLKDFFLVPNAISLLVQEENYFSCVQPNKYSELRVVCMRFILCCGETMMLYANLITKQSGKRNPIGYANNLVYVCHESCCYSSSVVFRFGSCVEC